MKVGKRSTPLDMISVELKGKNLKVSTHWDRIQVHVFKTNGQQLAYREFTFDQFCALFEQLRPGIHESITP